MNFFRKSWVFLKRDAVEAFSYRTQWILDGIQIIGNCAVFYFLARYFNGELQHHLVPGPNAVGYFPYVLLGIAFSDFQVTSLQSFPKAIYRELGYGTLEAILVTRTTLLELMFSSFLWSLLYSLLRLMFYILLGVTLFKVSFPAFQWLPTTLTLLLTITSMMGFGMISAGNALLFKRGDPLAYGMRGLSKFLSGVYFPVTLLPAWITPLSFLLPLTSALKAMRICLFQSGGIQDIRWELGILLLFSVLIFPAGVRYFQWAFRKAKKEGTLNFS